MAERKQRLQESLQWHQFAFDAESELQWIKDYLPAAASTDYGKNLIGVQKMHKKHQVSWELEAVLGNVKWASILMLKASWLKAAKDMGISSLFWQMILSFRNN